MLKIWEKMGNELSDNLKDIPENLHDFIFEIKTNYSDLLLKLGLIGDSNVKAESLVALHRFGTWASYGKPVFQVTPDLVASLILTNPQNVFVEEIQFPYKAFIIKIPDNFWELESMMDGESRKIPWIWVHEYRQRDSNLEDKMWWRIDAVSEDGTCITYFDKKPHGKISKFLNVGETIDSPLYVKMNPSEKGISFAMRRLVVNLCLYMSEIGDMKKKKVYTRFGKSRRKARPSPEVWVVGSGIKIGKELIEASKDWTRARQGNKAEWTIKRRFAVRGHWRNQPCGEERKLRKRIWIAPHWKGPGKGERLPRVYTVES